MHDCSTLQKGLIGKSDTENHQKIKILVSSSRTTYSGTRQHRHRFEPLRHGITATWIDS